MKKTKWLAVLLAMVMVLTMMPMVSFAADEGDTFTENGIHYRVTSDSTVAVISDTEDVTQHSTYTGEITIPATVSNGGTNYTVTAIDIIAFERSTVTKVTLPTTITTIERQAFYDCKTVTEIVLNEGLISIDDDAFNGCTALEVLILPDSLTSIGSSAFARCDSLRGLEIPAGVDDGISSALKGSGGSYPHLNEVKFAEGSPYDIYDGVLYKGTVLETQLDESQTEVTVKAGTTEIRPWAFGSIVSNREHVMERIIFQDDSLTVIGDYAFQYCKSLKEIDIPNSVTSIGTQAFMECISLEIAEFPESLENIGTSAFEGCEALKSVDIPEGVTEIPDYAFTGCLSLEKITLPEGLESIGVAAFCLIDTRTMVNNDPQLESINIPSTVTSLGEMFLGGLKPDGRTALISQTSNPSIYTVEALSGITGDGMNQPTMYYSDEYKDAYTNVEALTKSGLIPETESTGNPQQNYAFEMKETASVCPGKTDEESIIIVDNTAIPENAVLILESKDNSIVTVDESGMITGVTTGATEITGTLTLSGVTLATGTCVVTVGHSFTDGVCIVCGEPDPNYEQPLGPSQPGTGEGTTTGGNGQTGNGDSTGTDGTGAATGDDSMPLVWLAMMTLAAMGAAGAALYRRKQKAQ